MTTPTSKNIIDPYFPKQEKYKVGFIIYEQFTMLDLVGPAEILGDHPDLFETVSIGVNGDSLVNSWFNSLTYHTKLSIKEAKKQHFDLIVVPGGVQGTYAMVANDEFIQDFTELCNNTKVVFTVCTGALILAQTGLLDGLKATTNKSLFYKKTPDHPKVDWVWKARWVHHGKFITSSGITAGIDAALYILSLVKDKKAAEHFAEVLEYTANFDPDLDPFAKVYE